MRALFLPAIQEDQSCQNMILSRQELKKHSRGIQAYNRKSLYFLEKVNLCGHRVLISLDFKQQKFILKKHFSNDSYLSQIVST